MSYVICEPCVGCVDTACVSVCPCDCIVGPRSVAEIRAVPAGDRATRFPGLQLFIDPEHCIDCGACVPECPTGAIFPDAEVPAQWLDAVEQNAAFFRPA